MLSCLPHFISMFDYMHPAKFYVHTMLAHILLEGGSFYSGETLLEVLQEYYDKHSMHFFFSGVIPYS